MRSFWFLLLPVALLAQGRTPSNNLLEIPLLQAKHIFVVSIISVSPSQWQSAQPSGSQVRTLTLALRLQKNLQGELSLPEGATGEVTVKQLKYPAGMIWDNPEYWSYTDLRPGQTYLVFSRKDERDLTSLFERPDRTEEVSKGTAAQDVEFILQNAKLPLTEQEHNLISWLKDTRTRHGWHIGEYVAALLVSASGKNAIELRDFVNSGRVDEKLTEEGRHALLVAAFQRIKSSQRQLGDELMAALTKEALRLLLGEKQPGIFPTREQLDLLDNYLPWLIASPQVRTLLKQDVLTEAQRPTAVAELRTLENSNKLPAGSREVLVSLREVLEGTNP